MIIVKPSKSMSHQRLVALLETGLSRHFQCEPARAAPDEFLLLLEQVDRRETSKLLRAGGQRSQTTPPSRESLLN